MTEETLFAAVLEQAPADSGAVGVGSVDSATGSVTGFQTGRESQSPGLPVE